MKLNDSVCYGCKMRYKNCHKDCIEYRAEQIFNKVVAVGKKETAEKRRITTFNLMGAKR